MNKKSQNQFGLKPASEAVYRRYISRVMPFPTLHEIIPIQYYQSSESSKFGKLEVRKVQVRKFKVWKVQSSESSKFRKFEIQKIRSRKVRS